MREGFKDVGGDGVLKDLTEGKKVQDPTYTGLDVCTPENQDSCLKK